MAARTHYRIERAGQCGTGLEKGNRPKKLRLWANHASSAICPECLEAARHHAPGKTPLHQSPCPVHGDLALSPEDADLLHLAQQYRLQKWVRAAGDLDQWELIPDYPAIAAVLNMDEVQREQLEKLRLIFAAQRKAR